MTTYVGTTSITLQWHKMTNFAISFYCRRNWEEMYNLWILAYCTYIDKFCQDICMSSIKQITWWWP